MTARAGPDPRLDSMRSVNRAIARVLGREPGWSAAATAAEPGAAHAPEIVVVDAGGRAAVLVADFRPAAALRGRVEAAAAGGGAAGPREPACAVGVALPGDLAGCGLAEAEARLLACDALEYHVRAGGGHALPASGCLRGSMIDIRAAIRAATAPRDAIAEACGLAAGGMRELVGIIAGPACRRAQGEICRMLGQGPGEYTWRMAALVLLNAAALYVGLAGRRGGMPPLTELSAAGAASRGPLLAAWSRAGRGGLAPIFDSAAAVLRPLPDGAAGRVIRAMAGATSGLPATGGRGFGDFYGMLYQRQLYDRRRAAAFYTRPEAAALLAELAMRGPCDAAWRDGDALRKVRIADMACGSGSLLRAAYDHIVDCSPLDVSPLHADIMRSCLWGFDIFPVAAHFAASSLASAFPGQGFGECRIYARRIGAGAGGCRLGSLDLVAEDAPPGGDSLGHGSCDYVIMNPPFVRSTDHGERKRDPVPQYAVFGNTPEAQRAMSRRGKELFRGTCAHGNAGLGTYFLAVCHKKLRPGGRLGLILPDTLLSGESWAKSRLLVSEWYDDVAVVSVGHGRDGTYSADTGMHEVMLVGERRRSRRAPGDEEPRVKFVQLDRMPRSRLEALAVARCVWGADPPRLEDGAGRAALMMGGEAVGRAASCPIDGDRWWCRRAGDIQMLGLAYRLAHSLPLPAGTARPRGSAGGRAIPVTALGRVARMGRLHRDIADSSESSARAPFVRLPYARGSKFPCLWANDAEAQACMAVSPDSSLEKKPGASAGAVRGAWSTRTRLHLNNNVGYASQRLIAAYTERPTLGGRGWPNVMIDERFEKAMAVWCNSALGLLLYWSASGAQQPGRGMMGISAFRKSFFVLDATKLAEEQISALDGLFDRLCRRPLRPFSEIGADPVRRDLDASMLKILGVDGMDLGQLYEWISNDPQFSRAASGRGAPAAGGGAAE